jgi:hypothetical protein
MHRELYCEAQGRTEPARQVVISQARSIFEWNEAKCAKSRSL